MCDIVFRKNKRSWWDSISNECRSSHLKGSLKKVLMRILAEFTRKYLCRSLFCDKVKLCRSSNSLKMSLKCRCFLVNFAKFVRTPFLQNRTGRLLLIIAVSINSSERRIGKRKFKSSYKN